MLWHHLGTTLNGAYFGGKNTISREIPHPSAALREKVRTIAEERATILGTGHLWRATHPRMEWIIRCWSCRAACLAARQSASACTGAAANRRSHQACHIQRSRHRSGWRSGDKALPPTEDRAKYRGRPC